MKPKKEVTALQMRKATCKASQRNGEQEIGYKKGTSPQAFEHKFAGAEQIYDTIKHNELPRHATSAKLDISAGRVEYETINAGVHSI